MKRASCMAFLAGCFPIALIEILHVFMFDPDEAVFIVQCFAVLYIFRRQLRLKRRGFLWEQGTMTGESSATERTSCVPMFHFRKGHHYGRLHCPAP